MFSVDVLIINICKDSAGDAFAVTSCTWIKLLKMVTGESVGATTWWTGSSL